MNYPPSAEKIRSRLRLTISVTALVIVACIILLSVGACGGKIKPPPPQIANRGKICEKEHVNGQIFRGCYTIPNGTYANPGIYYP